MKKIVHFGKVSNLIADLLPDEPSKIIKGATKLGDLKKKIIKPKNLTSIKDKLVKAADEVGAVTGVLTTAAGAGVNKYIAKGKVGKGLKRAGVDTVLNDKRRKLTGGAVMAIPVVAAAGTGGTIIAKKTMDDKKGNG
jgi:hypothetical protein